jgi:polyisoprenoid-binding protein YceI
MITNALKTRPPVTPGTWTLDTRRSSAKFKARCLFGLVKVTGEIPIAEAKLSVTEMIAMTSLSAAVNTAGLNTGNPKRDKYLRDVVLDSANHPRLYFRAQGVAPSAYGWQTDGDVIVCGKSVPISLDSRFVQLLDGTIQLRTNTTLSWKGFGLKMNRRTVRNTVDVKIVARFRRV